MLINYTPSGYFVVFLHRVIKRNDSLTGAAEETEIQPPDPPLVLEHAGSTYGLETCSVVRRIEEPTANPLVYTTTESLRDVISNQRSTSCQVCLGCVKYVWLTKLRSGDL